ncbi:MAG: phenylalanine--tRNA ligase subunit beta [Burkholderiales bacterium]
MKFSENWLRAFVNPGLSSTQLAYTLTMGGVEVEAVEKVAPDFDHVVVGEVMSIRPHPDAQRLTLCQVNTGGDATLAIVCGAPDVRVGIKVPCALAGARLPGKLIRRATVRGQESHGMLCSAGELGMSADSEGLMLLPHDAPVGADVRAYLDLDDHVFVLKPTPNRSDCLSITGVAREVAALASVSMRVPERVVVPGDAADTLPVTVSDPGACGLYCGRIVRGVNAAAATPRWLVRRLERSGLRSHSALVDVTNYVQLELGQPLHAFDLDTLSGGIAVRFAHQGESLTLLNEQQRVLDPDMLVIADQAGPLALAGIMGGADSAVSDSTRDVFLESAFFDPGIIALAVRRLGLTTESAYRFERGVDFAATSDALERATALVLDICGGKAGAISTVQGQLPVRAPVKVRSERASRVLGIDVKPYAGHLLRRLGLSFAERDGVFFVTPPSYRFDLRIEADFIEEIARLHGYDAIPATLPNTRLEILPQGDRGYGRLHATLVARDYQEVVTYSFVDPQWEADFAANPEPAVLQNPIASQMSALRSTLWGGLIDTLCHNVNHKQERVRIFETGACFARNDKGFVQSERLAALCYGSTAGEQWGMYTRKVDFFDLKSDIEALLTPKTLIFERAQHAALHPGQSARVWMDGQPAGWIGALHPQWQQKYQLTEPALLFELDIEPLLQCDVPVFKDYSRYPAVRRDIAVIVDEDLSVGELLAAMRAAAQPIVVALELFDVYSGKGVAPGKKSLAFRALMQDTRKTLTDPEVDAAVSQITEFLTIRFNATLRSASGSTHDTN